LGIIFKYRKQGDAGQASYCISKAIKADPQDISLRRHQALLYAESQNYQKAAEAYEQVYQLCRDDVDALKAAAKVSRLLLSWIRYENAFKFVCCLNQAG
jgi:tetratricopeptide (TPR) repeat protein